MRTRLERPHDESEVEKKKKKKVWLSQDKATQELPVLSSMKEMFEFQERFALDTHTHIPERVCREAGRTLQCI